MIPRPFPSVLAPARITSVLSCPTCGRVLYSPTIREGEAWLKCNIAEKQRRGGCPAHWFNITMRPDASGLTLAGVVGRDAAVAILRTIVSSRSAEPVVLLGMQLASDPVRPVHVQLSARARDEHHFRYAPIGDVLKALQII